MRKLKRLLEALLNRAVLSLEEANRKVNLDRSAAIAERTREAIAYDLTSRRSLDDWQDAIDKAKAQKGKDGFVDFGELSFHFAKKEDI